MYAQIGKLMHPSPILKMNVHTHCNAKYGSCISLFCTAAEQKSGHFKLSQKVVPLAFGQLFFDIKRLYQKHSGFICKSSCSDNSKWLRCQRLLKLLMTNCMDTEIKH